MSDSVPQQGVQLQQVSPGQSQASSRPDTATRGQIQSYDQSPSQMGAASVDDSYPPRVIFRDLASI
ncbi:hypothetical protein [Ketogulonicigenium vulgare]|uniref:Uncharacterized protein n=1 Tax=Ketogulonicigenium vulgare (strain WSH-001) TaxID=759362 RepID=F9Y6S2_KETVW|nr:hypothetical protein [Ketogulonicigenium vulgare]ADO42752.1 hypothetical protein EIO_1628 [Ketogulonicigenium vulgare Y25]AEM40939.1 hypothetical protein KVU_1100 [Ketogulonicigenium vulgare WSH-001]ALJ81093.1 hypothetical protein KVH_07830 [Ketogulonicigenium vulgare]ANW35041.1 hypothetical protein KvSKV_07795 [Ketogulonicigenium vulgare]AOZ54664.1 hypothetical protein KVC_1651 [Ketogulonicigenium vulgare]